MQEPRESENLTPWTPERTALALQFCLRFEGTPHMQRRLQPGRGADCVRFVVGAIQAAGILPPFRWPGYPQDHGLHDRRNWLAGIFLDHSHSESLAIPDWKPETGDIGIFRVGRVSNHVGLVLEGRFWHVTTARPVHHCALATVTPRLQEAIRLTATGLRKPPEDIRA